MKRELSEIVKDVADRYGVEYDETLDGPRVKRKEYNITQIEPARHGMTVSSSGGFVKIEHMESGIAVTKYAPRCQIKAKEEAMNELQTLIAIWKKEVY